MQLQKINQKQQYNRWREYEDQALREMIQKQNYSYNWEIISQRLFQEFQIKRRGKQCRERWENHICKRLQDRSWTQSDDENIYNYHLIYGNSWVRYTEHFEGKTDLHIKNRYNSMIRKAVRKMWKFSQLKINKHKIYLIRPSTISKIFFKINPKLQSSEFDLPDYFSREKCVQTRNLIKLFIIKSQKNAVEIKNLSKASFQVLYKIIQVNENIIQKNPNVTNPSQQSMETQSQNQPTQSSQLIDLEIEKKYQKNMWADIFNVITETQVHICKFIEKDEAYDYNDYINTEEKSQFDQPQYFQTCRGLSLFRVTHQN